MQYAPRLPSIFYSYHIVCFFKQSNLNTDHEDKLDPDGS